jgi:hypothetical protein
LILRRSLTDNKIIGGKLIEGHFRRLSNPNAGKRMIGSEKDCQKNSGMPGSSETTSLNQIAVNHFAIPLLFQLRRAMTTMAEGAKQTDDHAIKPTGWGPLTSRRRQLRVKSSTPSFC